MPQLLEFISEETKLLLVFDKENLSEINCKIIRAFKPEAKELGEESLKNVDFMTIFQTLNYTARHCSKQVVHISD